MMKQFSKDKGRGLMKKMKLHPGMMNEFKNIN